MQVSIAGHADGETHPADFSYVPGQVVELHPTVAAAWIACGHAIAVAAETTVTAPVTAVKNAVKSATKRVKKAAQDLTAPEAPESTPEAPKAE
jgi:hypothetical protein